jgi:hypothetical protein
LVLLDNVHQAFFKGFRKWTVLVDARQHDLFKKRRGKRGKSGAGGKDQRAYLKMSEEVCSLTACVERAGKPYFLQC